MFLQNTASIVSSTNQLETLPKRAFNTLRNKTNKQMKINPIKTEASLFLKTQLNKMIKDELKAYRIKQKLEKQMLQFQKIKQKNKIVYDLHKVQKFRQKESENLRKKFDQYIKQKQIRQSAVQENLSIKKQIIIRKKKTNQQKIQSVRQRYLQIINQDIQNKLSTVDSITSRKSFQRIKSSMKSINTKENNLSKSLNTRKIVDFRIQNEERHRVTNYLRKMKHAESRILQKQVKNYERKQKSIKSKVKNLTKQRNLNEQSKMKQLEQRFNKKMDSYLHNYSKLQAKHYQLMMERSRISFQTREKVIRKKQINDSLLVDKTLDNFMKTKTNKQNIYQNNQNRMDLLRTKSNLMNKQISIIPSTIDFQTQEIQKLKEKTIHKLYEKLNRIKRLDNHQTLSKREREALVNLLDDQDPCYVEMVEFLNNSKTEFVKKKLQKQSEWGKADKTKKAARNNNKS